MHMCVYEPCYSKNRLYPLQGKTVFVDVKNDNPIRGGLRIMKNEIILKSPSVVRQLWCEWSSFKNFHFYYFSTKIIFRTKRFAYKDFKSGVHLRAWKVQ